MAGRGRGRGRGLSINIEALGLGKGENLPPIAVPPPLFPPLAFKPVPLSGGEDWDYMLALKQELTETFRKSVFYIKPAQTNKDIERYSDKYQLAIADTQTPLNCDWSRLPAELHEKPKRKRTKTSTRPNLKSARVAKDVTSLLEKLEQKDGEQDKFEDADEEEKKEEGDEEAEVEDDVDDEIEEEDNDYNMDYFDNGENYEDNDNDDDDGPTY